MGPVVRDNNRNFVSCWEVPAASIIVTFWFAMSRIEHFQVIFKLVFLRHLQSVLEDASPTVVREDEGLQYVVFPYHTLEIVPLRRGLSSNDMAGRLERFPA
jgi:hypothetical protein